jgi:hypothetical protein
VLSDQFSWWNFPSASVGKTQQMLQYCIFLIFVSEVYKMAADEGGIEWLYELLQDVQLEQFFTRIRDDLQVISLGERKVCLNVKNDCCLNIETVFFLGTLLTNCALLFIFFVFFPLIQLQTTIL